MLTDKVAYYKDIYERNGPDRSNRAYGYVQKG